MNTAAAIPPVLTHLSTAPSVSVQLRPEDPRCSYWAKIIRADQDLPVPSDVERAVDIGAAFLRKGDEELFPATCCSRARRTTTDMTEAGVTG